MQIIWWALSWQETEICRENESVAIIWALEVSWNVIVPFCEHVLKKIWYALLTLVFIENVALSQWLIRMTVMKLNGKWKSNQNFNKPVDYTATSTNKNCGKNIGMLKAILRIFSFCVVVNYIHCCSLIALLPHGNNIGHYNSWTEHLCNIWCYIRFSYADWIHGRQIFLAIHTCRMIYNVGMWPKSSSNGLQEK